MKPRLPVLFRFLIRLGIVITFVLVGVGAFYPTLSPGYRVLSPIISVRWFGFLFLVSALWCVWNTVRREQLNMLAVILWFLYTGGVIVATLRDPSVPPHVWGAYTIAGLSIFAEAVFPIGTLFYGTRN